jgi:hypothetical protein
MFFHAAGKTLYKFLLRGVSPRCAPLAYTEAPVGFEVIFGLPGFTDELEHPNKSNKTVIKQLALNIIKTPSEWLVI